MAGYWPSSFFVEVKKTIPSSYHWKPSISLIVSQEADGFWIFLTRLFFQNMMIRFQDRLESVWFLHHTESITVYHSMIIIIIQIWNSSRFTALLWLTWIFFSCSVYRNQTCATRFMVCLVCRIFSHMQIVMENIRCKLPSLIQTFC